MAKEIRKQALTKKHLARIQREQMQTRFILIGSLIVLVAVVLLIGYGILDQTYLQYQIPVAKVNNDSISVREFQANVRFQRVQIINNYVQFASYFGSDPSASTYLSQFDTLLDPTTLGQNVVDSLIQDRLIRQEAARRGITVTSAEVDQAIQANFGYYANGTPTPTVTPEFKPTSTLSAEQLTFIATPTPTATITATVPLTPTATPTFTPTPAPTMTPTAGPSPTPEPSATPYTLQGFQDTYKTSIANLNKQFKVAVSDADLRRIFESELYRQKVEDAILTEMNISREEDQVWARKILVPDLALAQVVLEKVKAGDNFITLAKEYSTDATKSNGGDLGWFGKGQLDPTFEKVAFELKVGEVVSQPVQTQDGYNIIQVLGHEVRPLSANAYNQLRTTSFQTWLDGQRAAAKVETFDVWKDKTPTDPAKPDLTQPQTQP